MTKPKRLGRDWTRRDVKTMRECARRGLSAKACANRVQRTRGAVAYKAMVEGVRFRAINQPRGAQRRANRTKRANARAAA